MTLIISCGMASLIPFFRILRIFGRVRWAGLGGRSDWNGQGSDLAALKPDRAVYRVHVLVIDQEQPIQRIEQTSQFSLSIFARTSCFTITSRWTSRVIPDCSSRTDKIYQPTLVGGLRCCERCSSIVRYSIDSLSRTFSVTTQLTQPRLPEIPWRFAEAAPAGPQCSRFHRFLPRQLCGIAIPSGGHDWT
jgi:hypothetical protein